MISKVMENCINTTNVQGKGNKREPGNCRGISLLPILENYIPE